MYLAHSVDQTLIRLQKRPITLLLFSLKHFKSKLTADKNRKIRTSTHLIPTISIQIQQVTRSKPIKSSVVLLEFSYLTILISLMNPKTLKMREKK